MATTALPTPAAPATLSLLLELDYLNKGNRLPHGDCGIFVGKPCSCYLARVSDLLLAAREHGVADGVAVPDAVVRVSCEECRGKGQVERDHTIHHGDTVGDESVVALFDCEACDGNGYIELSK